MEQGGLSKDELQHLFENLEVLKSLAEQCIASNAKDSRICHPHSDRPVQIASETAPSSDHRQTTADASGRSTESRGGTRAVPSSITSNADTVTHVVLTAESLDQHANIPSHLSFHSTVMPSNGRIRSNALEATDSVDRGSHNRQLISNASNRPQASFEGGR